MTWSYRNPHHFPVMFQTAIIQAAASPDHDILFYHATSHSDAIAKAAMFRHFKWCLNQLPAAMPNIWEIGRNFKFRTKTKPAPESLIGHSHTLWIRAQPKSDFEMLILKTKYDTQQVITYRSPYEVDRWLDQTCRDIERMIGCWKDGWWDYNLDHACAEYGGCALQTVCKSSDPET